jgi:hypothetical protein
MNRPVTGKLSPAQTRLTASQGDAQNARLLTTTRPTDMTRNPLLILLNHQRASAGRVRLPFVIGRDGSN